MLLVAPRPTMRCVLVRKARKGSPSPWRNQLLAIADKYEARIRRRLIDAIGNLRDEASLRRLAEAFQSGSQEAIMSAAKISDMNVALGPVTDAHFGAHVEVGLATARTYSSKLNFRFDATHDAIVRSARRNAYDLITRITSQTRDAVRNAISHAVDESMNPRQAARSIRGVIGLTVRDEQALTNYRRGLRERDFSAALSRNLGPRLEGQSERVMSQDGRIGASTLDDLTEKYRDRLVRARAETIARTEGMRAVNTGVRAAWEQAFSDNPSLDPKLARRYWIATDDERTRESHREIPDLNADGVGLDEPFRLPDGGTIMFPHDPDAPASETINCRCTVYVRYDERPGDNEVLPPLVPGRSILPDEDETD
jgi:hypothetical protein